MAKVTSNDRHKKMSNQGSYIPENPVGMKVKDEDDIFVKMVKSKKFQKYTRDTIALFKKDPSQFVDPFETFKKRNAQ